MTTTTTTPAIAPPPFLQQLITKYAEKAATAVGVALLAKAKFLPQSVDSQIMAAVFGGSMLTGSIVWGYIATRLQNNTFFDLWMATPPTTSTAVPTTPATTA